MSEMGENENSRASRMLDDLVQEGMGQQQAQSSNSAPVLPRIKMVRPKSAAPIPIRKKDFSKSEKLPDIGDLLPQIVKEASEKVQAEQALQAGRDLISAMDLQLDPSVPAPRPLDDESLAFESVLAKVSGNTLGADGKPMPARVQASRRKRRYDLAFGKPFAEGLRKKHIDDVTASDLEDKAIYKAKEGDGKYGVASGLFHNPRVVAWSFLVPALIAFTVFSWLPMVRGFILSLGDVTLSGGWEFVGLDNYFRAFNDPQFLGALGHALALCLLSLGLGFFLPVFLAIYMNELKGGAKWVRLAFFLPFLTPTVPAVLLWRWIFDQGYGLLNSVAYIFMDDPFIPWLNDPTLALISIVIVFVWKNTGWNALIYWTSLQDVDETLYETAELDGTTLWQRVKHVSLPALKGTMIVLMIMQVINTVQIFTEVFLMTGGGPMGSTEVITTYMYKKSFLYLDIGYASAMAVILFLILAGFTAIRMKTIEKEA